MANLRETGRAVFRGAAIVSFATTPLLCLLDALADPTPSFYQGKTITLFVSTSPGGDYDTRARLLARHMHRHIYCDPQIVVQNMPGAGGLRGANWLASLAAQDGTALAALQQQLPLSQLFRTSGVDYDVTRFHVVGNTSASPIVVMAGTDAQIRSFADARSTEFVGGGTAGESASVQVPLMLNAVLGTKFKVVPGYPGGSEIYLAMERGEIAGRVTQNWSGWKSQKPDWIAAGKILPLVKGGRKRHPELQNIPLLSGFAANQDDRRLIKVMMSSDEIARPVYAAQGTPTDRLAQLRAAFMASVRDNEFLSEAAKLKVEIEPMSGEEAQAIIQEMMSGPAAIIERAKRFAGDSG